MTDSELVKYAEKISDEMTDGDYVVVAPAKCPECGWSSKRVRYAWDGQEFCVRCNCGEYLDLPKN